MRLITILCCLFGLNVSGQITSAQAKKLITEADSGCTTQLTDYEKVCFAIEVEGDKTGPPLEYIWSKDQDTIRGRDATFCIIKEKNETVCLSSYDPALHYTSEKDTCYNLFLANNELSFATLGNVQINNTINFVISSPSDSTDYFGWDMGNGQIMVGNSVKYVYQTDGPVTVSLYKIKQSGDNLVIADCAQKEINIKPYRSTKK